MKQLKIFNVGLRRSGNTILRTVLEQDSRFTCYSEPLRLGGGPNTKYLKKLKRIRNKFLMEFNLSGKKHSIFNFGAPRNLRQEVAGKLPEFHKKYLKFLLDSAPFVFLKLVRVAAVIKDLYEICPDAKLIHIVRDPRRFVMSHIFVHKYKTIRMYDFFTRRSEFNYWHGEELINIITRFPEYTRFINKPAYFKLLLVWKFSNDLIEITGKKYFNHNYMKIKHEDLCNHSEQFLRHLYGFLELNCPKKVSEWAQVNVKKPRKILYSKDKHWKKAYKKLKINY